MKSVKKLSLALVGAVMTIGALASFVGTPASAVSSYRNCNNDAIVRCGAVTESELLQKYDQNAGDIQNIYRHYGISRNDLAGQRGEVVHGTVHQDGRVMVGNKVVATNAYSLSRVAYNDSRGNKPRTVKINGTTLYEGPNMSIFVRSVDAYLFMRDGQFYRGVISSCANPLMATPTPKPKPAPQPVKPTPKPEPKPVKPIEKPIEKPKPEKPVEKPTPVKVVEVEKIVEVEKVVEKEKEEEEVVVTELPQTGLQTLLSGGLGIGSITAAGYYWAASRRNLLDTLLNK